MHFAYAKQKYFSLLEFLPIVATVDVEVPVSFEENQTSPMSNPKPAQAA